MCQHPGWKEVMTSIPQALPEKALHRNESARSRGLGAMWIPKQKNVSWKKNLAGKLTREIDLVMIFFAGTYLAAEVCMLLAQHTKFVGCALD